MKTRLLSAALVLVTACQFELTREVGTGELRGRAVLRTDGAQAPVSGARAQVVKTRSGARTASDGAFVVRGLPAGRYDLRLSTATDVPGPEYGLLIRGVELTDGVDLGTLVLGAVGSIEGVVTQGGVPVAGARVSGEFAPIATTDAEGRFLLERLVPGAYGLVVERADGVLFVRQAVTVAAAARVTVPIDLGALTQAGSGRVTGRVQGASGGVTITIERDGVTVASAETNADGTFDTGTVPPGIYMVTGRGRDGASLRVGPIVIAGDVELGAMLLAPASDLEDDDDDGVLDAADRCPQVFDPGQENQDGDTLGDACDDDVDGDGIANDQDSVLSRPGAAISGTVGAELAPIAITLVDARGRPRVNVPVTIAVASGDATPATQEIRTDAQGRVSATVTLGHTAGSVAIRITAAGAPALDVPVTAVPGPLQKFVLVGPEQAVTAGAPTTFELLAADEWSNLRSDSVTGVQLTTTDARATLPSTWDLGPDHSEITVTFRTAGAQTVTAQVGELVGVLGVDVLPAAIAKLVFVGPITQAVAGTSENFQLEARDADDQPVPGYSGKATLTSSDPSADLPAPRVFSPITSTASATVTFMTAGTQTLTATDEDGITTGPLTIEVVAGAPSNFTLSVPGGVKVGLPFLLQAQLTDRVGNPTSYVGTLRFDVNDARAIVPGPVTLDESDAGASSVLLTMRKAGSHTIRVAATALAGVVGSANVVASSTSPVIAGVAGPETEARGVSEVVFTATQEESQRVDVRAEFSLGGDVWKPATQAGGSAGSGVSAITTSAAGVPHVWLWDSARDLPNATASVGLRLTPILNGVAGTAGQATVLVNNTLRFGTPTTIGSGTGWRDVVIADFNHDHQPDFALLDEIVGEIRVYMNEGDTYGTPETYTAANCNGLVLYDQNDDGNPDLITVDNTAAVVRVFKGLHGGGFTQATPAATGLTFPSALAAGDLNGDTWGDVAVVGAGNQIAYLHGNSFGLALAGSVTVPHSPDHVSIADVTGDRRGDLLVGGKFSDKVSVFPSKAGGGFNTPITHDVSGAPTHVQAADLNADGRLDLVVAGLNNVVAVLLATGPSSWGPVQTSIAVNNPLGLVVADMDGNGTLDVVTPQFNGRMLLVFPNDGFGLLGTPLELPLNALGRSVAAGDFDSDGDLDLVALTDGPITIFRANVARRSAPALAAADLVAPQLALSKVLATDFNDDGRQDLIGLGGSPPGIYLLAGRGDGTFAAPDRKAILPGSVGLAAGPIGASGGWEAWTATAATGFVSIVSADAVLQFDTGAGVGDLAATDVNRDGLYDLVVSQPAQNRVKVFLRSGTTFASAITTAVPARPTELVVQDVTADGMPDLLVTTRDDGKLLLLPGRGDGSFGTANPLAFASTPAQVVTRDFDRDGDPDLLVANVVSGSAELVLARNDGAGVFDVHARIPGLSAARSGYTTQDVTGDGFEDVLVALPTGLKVYANDGNQGFDTGLAVSLGVNLGALAFEDLDGDLRPDLFTPYTAGGVGVARGRASGLLVAPEAIVGAPPAGIALGDFDQDGRTDVVGASTGTGGFFLFPGTAGGGFTSANSFGTGSDPQDLVVADLDRDGHEDVVVISHGEQQVTVHFGLGDGDFATARVLPLSAPPTALQVGDALRNGLAEIYVGIGGAAPGVVRFDQSAPRSFSAEVPVLENTPVTGITLGDFDSNGVIVALVSGPDGLQSISDFFTFPTPIAQDNVSSGIAMGDLDEDGMLDLVGTDTLHNGAFVYLAASPTSSVVYPTGPDPARPNLVDVDADGHLDVVLTNAGRSVVYLRGRGDGTFETARGWVAGPGVEGLATRDLNRDGLVDVVVANRAGGNVSRLMGR